MGIEKSWALKAIASGGRRFLRHDIFEMEFLLFQAVDEIGVGEGPVFFALQFVFKFGMLDAKRGHMTVVHLILLIVRLDDLT